MYEMNTCTLLAYKQEKKRLNYNFNSHYSRSVCVFEWIVALCVRGHLKRMIFLQLSDFELNRYRE